MLSKTTRKRKSEALEATNRGDDISSQSFGHMTKRSKKTPTSTFKADQIKSNDKVTISLSNKDCKKDQEADYSKRKSVISNKNSKAKSVEPKKSDSKSETLLTQKLDRSDYKTKDDFDDEQRHTKYSLRPRQRWDPVTYFNEIAQSVPPDMFDGLVSELYSAAVAQIRVIRKPEQGKYVPVYVKDTYNRIMENLVAFLYDKFPPIKFCTMYGVEFPSLAAIRAKDNEQDLKYFVILSILSGKGRKTQENPIFVVKYMNKSVSQEILLLKTYFKILCNEGVSKKFYGILVDSTEMIFVKYDDNLYQSKSFPLSLKEEFRDKKSPSEKFKSRMKIITSMIIESVQEVSSILKL